MSRSIEVYFLFLAVDKARLLKAKVRYILFPWKSRLFLLGGRSPTWTSGPPSSTLQTRRSALEVAERSRSDFAVTSQRRYRAFVHCKEKQCVQQMPLPRKSSEDSRLS